MKSTSLSKQVNRQWLAFLQSESHVPSSPYVTALLYEKEYPLSFISFFIKNSKHNIITIDLSDTQNSSVELFERMLKSTFLGVTCTYVIKTPWADLSHIQQKYLLRIIDTYSGPHHCIIPVEPSVVSVITAPIYLVEIPPVLTAQETLLVAQYSSVVVSSAFQKMLKTVSHQSEHISFSLVITLLDYAAVVSSIIIDDFSKQMLPLLVNAKQSLYELSSQLFSKKSSFFQLWYQTEPTYSQAFWTTFWCDQLMKAALFCTYKKSGSAQEAQLIGTGLPFSFLNKDWRLYKPEGLIKGYNALYEYDCRVKDRILIKSLDSFFIMFFRHEFD